jgi:hypothetical protein
MTAEDIRKSGADIVVLATGSRPSREGFQRSLPHVAALPGAGQENVTTVHDVLEGTVVPGSRVLLLDDINGWWPASGTALHLAQDRHQVTVVTAAEKAAGAPDLSLTGDTTRERFAKFGVEVLLARVLTRWSGTTATIADLYTGEAEEREFDNLVLACTNTPDDRLTAELADSGLEIRTLGDAVAARSAGMAIYEARKLAVSL